MTQLLELVLLWLHKETFGRLTLMTNVGSNNASRHLWFLILNCGFEMLKTQYLS